MSPQQWCVHATIPLNEAKILLVIPVRTRTADTDASQGWLEPTGLAQQRTTLRGEINKHTHLNTEKPTGVYFKFTHTLTHSHSLTNNLTVTTTRQQSNATVQRSKKYLKIYNYYLQVKYTVFSYYRYSVWFAQNIQQYVHINFISLEHYKYNK